MEIRGEYRLPAPRRAVWDALNDPAVLKACIPYCDGFERTSEREFTATLTARIGPLKARFGGLVRLDDVVVPERYTISAAGKGGIAGSVKGAAKVHLLADGEETVLTYHVVDAEIGGRIATFGARYIEDAARKLSTRFFDNLAAQVANGAKAET